MLALYSDIPVPTAISGTPRGKVMSVLLSTPPVTMRPSPVMTPVVPAMPVMTRLVVIAHRFQVEHSSAAFVLSVIPNLRQLTRKRQVQS
jgi:hypothetical protein